jgi:5,6-dimethylbenzimidazole synthase
VEDNDHLQSETHFSAECRDALYKVIFSRRDVRGQFITDKPVPDEVLSRVLYSAHHAPSVGFMQPWNFLVIRDAETKARVHSGFVKAHAEAARMFEEDKREIYRTLKLEGILESPLNVCITCDRSRTGPVVIGRTAIPEMDLYSSVCAVQNFWLAARAEGLGVGWVSIIDEDDLRESLGIPQDIVPIAYLCVGYVSHFFARPELEDGGWLPREPLQDLIYFDQWQNRTANRAESLLSQIVKDTDISSVYLSSPARESD